MLDYLWGPPAESILAAVGGSGSGKAEPRIRFVQIGSMAGPTISFPAGPLRSSGLELLGSGLGSASHAAIVASVGEVMNAVEPGKLTVDAEPVPLADVAEAWGQRTERRIVFTVR